jgi:SAM-dependent methyltransferase
MMAARADSSAHAAARPSLLARIMSRLRGESTSPGTLAELPFDLAAPPAKGEEVPPLDPLTVRQWLWGEGFVVPGNADYVLKLVKPLAPNPAMSLLDVAAGLGGPARAVAQAFDTYVTGFERDHALAQRGMELSVAHGQQKRAPVSAIDPEGFELKPAAFDAILARGATYMVQDKERFMRVLILGLKPHGALVLTDYVVEPSLAERPELGLWSTLQPHKASLWTVQQYVDCFKSLGFEVHVTEDVTHDVKQQIILGWDHLIQTVDIKSLPREHKRVLVGEAEHWVKTIMAFDAGVVKAYRFYVVAGPSRPPLSSIKKGGK